MNDNITLTVELTDAETVLALFEDKAKHSDIVAQYQRRLNNEDGAKRAEARAQMLRKVCLPLADVVEEQKRQRAVALAEAKALATVEVEAKAVKKSKKVRKTVKEVKEVTPRVSFGDEIRAKASKKAKATA